MSALPKPVLRGHIKRRGIRGLIGAVIFGCVNASLYKIFVAIPRQKAHEEFLRTYDPVAHFKDLHKWKYLQFSKSLEEVGIYEV